MRPAPVLAALGLLWASAPAQACHRFSIWRYPQAQHCKVRLPVVASWKPRSAPARMDTATAPSAPAVELPLDEDTARAKAIERLKLMLGDSQ